MAPWPGLHLSLLLPASSEPSVSFLFLFVWRTKAVCAAKGNEFKETPILDFLRAGECTCTCEGVRSQEHTRAHVAAEGMAVSFITRGPGMGACAEGHSSWGPFRLAVLTTEGGMPWNSTLLLPLLSCSQAGDALVEGPAYSMAVFATGSGGQPDVTPLPSKSK